MTRLRLLFAFLSIASVCAAAGAAPGPLPEVEIINLYDAFGKDTDEATESFGFSALVRFGDNTILFDAGTRSDILEANVEALGSISARSTSRLHRTLMPTTSVDSTL